MIAAVVSAAIWLAVASALQFSLADRIAIGQMSPDFLITISVVISMNRSSDAAAAIGFFAGLFHGSIVHDKTMAYAISRMIGTLVGANLHSRAVGGTLLSAGVIVALATLAAGTAFLFLGVREHIGRHIVDTILSAIYNGVIAVPFFWLYRSISRPPKRK
jgi:hypothetical protein